MPKSNSAIRYARSDRFRDVGYIHKVPNKRPRESSGILLWGDVNQHGPYTDKARMLAPEYKVHCTQEGFPSLEAALHFPLEKVRIQPHFDRCYRGFSWRALGGRSLYADVFGREFGHAALFYYGDKLRQTEVNSQRIEIEKALTEAYDNRELLAALMHHDWLGLQFLAHLRACGRMRFSDFLSRFGVDTDHLAGIIAQLARGGVVSLKDEVWFVCTEKGLNLLQNLERNSGVSLSPQS